MTSTNRGVRASMLIAFAGVVGMLALLAAPAGAQTTSQVSGGARATGGSVGSGTCVATTDSVCSGSGSASVGSTSSGSAVATNGSVSSGCATATNLSTASGGCPAPTTTRPPAAVATTVVARGLALTGSSSGELAALALAALVAGGLLVLVSARRPAES